MNKLIIAALGCAYAMPVLADDDLKDMSAAYLISECTSALEENLNFSALAVELASRSELEISTEQRFLGMRCLKEHFNEVYFFDLESNSFISQTDDRENKQRQADREETLSKLATLAEERASANRRQYRNRLIDACFSKLKFDEFSALTNPLCAEVFQTRGFEEQ